MKVKFVPQNIECEIKPGQSVLHVAQDNNLYIKSVCKGVPSCAECRVYVKDGDHNVLPPASNELALIGTAHFVDGRRLSCQLKCFGDVTIDLTEQLVKQDQMASGKGKPGADDSSPSAAVMGNFVNQETMMSMQSTSSAAASGGPSSERGGRGNDRGGNSSGGPAGSGGGGRGGRGDNARGGNGRGGNGRGEPGGQRSNNSRGGAAQSARNGERSSDRGGSNQGGNATGGGRSNEGGSANGGGRSNEGGGAGQGPKSDNRKPRRRR